MPACAERGKSMDTMCQKVFEQIDRRLDGYLAFWKELVQLESFSSDKAGVDRVSAHIAQAAERLGLQVHVEPFAKAGNGLLLTLHPDAPLPAVCLMGHMDTVFAPGSFQPLLREADGKLYGPGVFDMKGGIAIALLVMDALQAAGFSQRPVKLILIGDEEVGESLSGQAGVDFIRASAQGSAAVLNCESGHAGSITVARRGHVRYAVQIHGKASHAGSAYNEGISAIKEAAHKILEIEQGCDPAAITYNCGVISGGTVSNTIPEFCQFEIDCRYAALPQLQELREHVEGILEHSYIPGTVCTYQLCAQRDPMERNERNLRLFEHIRKASLACGLSDVKPIARGGGSDASITSAIGVPSVCTMGVIGGKSHSLDEYAEIDSFCVQAKRIAASIVTLPADFGA